MSSMTFKIEGLKELNRALERIDKKVQASEIRKAARKSVVPTFKRIQMSVPVGSKPHRTYLGTLVSPGFLRRSIRLFSRIDKKRGAAQVMVGPRAEAFYGSQFLELGFKSYSGKHIFAREFRAGIPSINRGFKQILKTNINRAAKKR